MRLQGNMDKADGGFDAATFAQQFNQFSPEYGPHFKDIYRACAPTARLRAPMRVAASGSMRYADIMRVDADDEGFSSLYAVFPGVNPDTPRQGSGRLVRSAPDRSPPARSARRARLHASASSPLSSTPSATRPIPQGPRPPVLAPRGHRTGAVAFLLSHQLDPSSRRARAISPADLSTPLASLFTMKFLGLPARTGPTTPGSSSRRAAGPAASSPERGTRRNASCANELRLR